MNEDTKLGHVFVEPLQRTEGVPSVFERYMELHPGIDGWFSKPAAALWDSLLSFQKSAGIQGDMLEIGVWEGKSAALMAMHASPNSTCTFVDKKLRAKKIEFALKMANLDPEVRIQLLEEDSRRLHAHGMVAEGHRGSRWIHIDGEHTAGAIANDMELARNMLSEGGVLVIDDFFSWLYPQITEGVFRYVREHPDDFSLFLCGYNKAYLARPHFVHRYLEFCVSTLPQNLEDRGVVATVGKTTYPAEMNTFGVGPRFQDAALRGPDWDSKTIRY